MENITNNSKRWLYLAAGTVVLLFVGLIYAWSIFKVPFSQIYSDWTLSQLSMTFTISMAFFCIGGYLGGLLSKKFSVKIRLLIALVLLFVGFFTVSTLTPGDSHKSLIMVYIFYGVFGGSGVGFAYNAVVTTITRWFPDKTGLATGIMLMGFGIGGLALGSAVNSMIGSMGIFSTFRVLSIDIAVVLLLGILIIKAPEAPAASNVSAAADEEEEDGNPYHKKNYTSGDMLRSGRFWVFMAWTIVLNSAGLLVINSAANISVAYGGTAVLGLIISLFNGIGRIIAGNNFDKFGRKITMTVNNIFYLIAAVLLIFGGKADNLPMVIIGLIFVGMAYGGTPTISSTYTNKAFGPKYFATNFSIANFSLLPAAIIGPMMSASLLEKAHGNYGSNFMAILVIAVLGAVIMAVLNVLSKKYEN